MPILVQKFGGTSIATIERLKIAAEKIMAAKQQGYKVVVVVSAMGDETDRLVELAGQLSEQPTPREYDMLLAAGEQKAMALLAIALNKLACPAVSMTGWQAGIHTTARFNLAKIIDIDTREIHANLNAGSVCIIAGFQGISEGKEITTLGRGGSDLSAVALSAALKAEECQIFTDVDGVHTADPNLVPEAARIDEINSEEMLALSSFGAKVLHGRAVELAAKLSVPLRVLSSFKAGQGTLVHYANSSKPSPVSGITYHRDQLLLTFPGLAEADFNRVLTTLRRAEVEVSLVEEDLTSLVIDVSQLSLVKAVLADVAFQVGGQLASVTVVGELARSCQHTRQKIQQYVDSCSEIILLFVNSLKFSILIPESDLELVVSGLHRLLGLDSGEVTDGTNAEFGQAVQ